MLNNRELEKSFKELGLCKGDTVLVHSSYKSLGPVEGGPETVIRAILDVVGEEGTLIAPTFNFDFCKGEPFDIRTTPSQMGIITEMVRKNPLSTRNLHPIYSFAFIGKNAKELGNMRYKSSYGSESVFQSLKDMHGKIMIIGLPYNHSMTFFHHVEEIEGCDYRYFKSFTGKITDETGNSYEDTFIMLVRNLDRGVITAVEPMGEVLEREGAVNIRRIGAAEVKLMKAREVYKITAQNMKNNPGLLYRIDKR